MRKLIYLISPNQIQSNFFDVLENVLASKKVKFFQLRLKNLKNSQIISIGRKVKKITRKYKVKLIVNDSVKIAKILKADGCHLGQKDCGVIKARNHLRKKIIGVTCHNSKILAKKAIKEKADYLAFGSFYNSKLKPNAKKTNFEILKWAKTNVSIPIVAIGGINNLNYKKLLKYGAKYIAISSYIWDNPKLKPETAIRKFK